MIGLQDGVLSSKKRCGCIACFPFNLACQEWEIERANIDTGYLMPCRFRCFPIVRCERMAQVLFLVVRVSLQDDDGLGDDRPPLTMETVYRDCGGIGLTRIKQMAAVRR